MKFTKSPITQWSWDKKKMSFNITDKQASLQIAIKPALPVSGMHTISILDIRTYCFARALWFQVFVAMCWKSKLEVITDKKKLLGCCVA